MHAHGDKYVVVSPRQIDQGTGGFQIDAHGQKPADTLAASIVQQLFEGVIKGREIEAIEMAVRVY